MGMTELTIRALPSSDLTAHDTASVRALLWAAFAGDEHGGFSEHDWQHSLGGMHWLAEVGSQIVAHTAVVERDIHVGGQPLRTGYVEAVATLPTHQRRGYGSAVMRAVNDYIDAHFELGALGTSSHAFYHRLGWQTWQGRSFVRTADDEQATPDEDGYILVLRTSGTPPLDATAQISCEWRPGDVW
jgi:aminoglycoside 2'-N-acetyltransferase I